MRVKTLGPKGVDLVGSHIELEKGTKCERGRWASKGVDRDVPYWLVRRTKHPLKSSKEDNIY